MKKLKTILTTILTAVFVMISVLSVYASNVTIKFNNNIIKFNTDPIIVNNRVMVPMRDIFERLGYEIIWNPKNQVIRAVREDIEMHLRIGSLIANINGENYSLDSPPVIVDGVTLVPIRFISDHSGANVNWDNITNTVYISNEYNFSIDAVKSSVVQINIDNKQGSGFLIGDGIIVTNRHVLKDAKEVTIVFDDFSIYDGDIRVIGFDEISDIAIIRINELGRPYLKLADSDNVNIGDEVIAIGSPLGKLNVVTRGNVIGILPGIIVSSAKIEQGSSGGVLLNDVGEAIGITFSYDSGKNYFSIPINDVKSVYLNKDFTLEQYSHFETIIKPPSRFSTNSNGDLYWENVYGSDGYYIYISDSLNGVYKQVKNPNTDEYIWYWGYPKGFGIKNSVDAKFYIKVASIKDGVISSMSMPIEIIKSK